MVEISREERVREGDEETERGSNKNKRHSSGIK